MSDPRAGGPLAELLHAVDGRVVLVAAILVCVAGFAMLLVAGPDLDALGDPDAPDPEPRLRPRRRVRLRGDDRGALSFAEVIAIGVVLLILAMAAQAVASNAADSVKDGGGSSGECAGLQPRPDGTCP